VLFRSHGNRYDGWNAVAYGALRAFKSAATRAEANASFEAPAGSRLVAAVMNPLKIRYRFIDLLKPENETVIPILCALEPKLAFELTNVAPLWLAMRGASGKPGRVREEETYIAGGVPAAGREPASPGVVDSPAHERACQATEAILADARAAAQEVSSSERAGRVAPDDTQIAGGARDWLASNLSLWRARAARPFQRYRLLARALAAHRKAIATTFELTSQDPPYYTAASRLHQEAGARVVLFGHTHLAKAIALGERGAYLNTGTWVPTIRLPASFYEPSPDDPTIEQLAAFVDDLASNRFEPWTSLQTCCAHVRLAPDGTSRAALCEVQADGSVTQLFADPP